MRRAPPAPAPSILRRRPVYYDAHVIERVTHEAREGRGWAIDDPVVRLRVWGDERAFELPPPGVDTWTIGAAAECDLRLDDPTGCVSRRHAQLVREGAAWQICDLGSTN